MILDHASGTRSAFRDQELQQHYDQEGYVVVPLLGQSEVAELVAVANRTYAGARGFISSSTESDIQLRRRLADIVIDTCAPAIARAMAGYRLTMGGFLIKPAHDPQVYFEPHVDWSLVDEPRVKAVQVWMPLADTDVASGGLFILPRSFKLIDTPRGSPHRFTHALERLEPEQIMKYGIFMSMRAGDALLMDPRTVHWSPPNATGNPRIAIVLGLAPEEAELRHYYGRPDGTFHEYAVDDEFFRTFNTGDVPSGRYVGPVDIVPNYVDEETVWRVCAPDMTAAPRRLQAANGTPPPRLAFFESSKQRALDREGFATFPLLGESELLALRDVADESRARAEARPLEAGLYDSAHEEDIEFRRRVSKQVSAVCAPALERVFADAEILIGSVLVKTPTNEQSSTPPEPGPTLVDEPLVSSCQILVPLTDSSPESGSLRLLARSHRLVDSPRGPGLGHQFEALSSEEFEHFAHELDLRAGEAVAWDQRIPRSLSSNTSGESVLAVGMTLVPRGAALQRFGLGHDMRVHQYRVHKGGFDDHRISDQPVGEDLGPVVFAPRPIAVEDLIALFQPPPAGTARRVLSTVLLRVPPGAAARVPDPIKRLARDAAARLT